jgi:hypothetical protein
MALASRTIRMAVVTAMALLSGLFRQGRIIAGFHGI